MPILKVEDVEMPDDTWVMWLDTYDKIVDHDRYGGLDTHGSLRGIGGRGVMMSSVQFIELMKLAMRGRDNK